MELGLGAPCGHYNVHGILALCLASGHVLGLLGPREKVTAGNEQPGLFKPQEISALRGNVGAHIRLKFKERVGHREVDPPKITEIPGKSRVVLVRIVRGPGRSDSGGTVIQLGPVVPRDVLLNRGHIHQSPANRRLLLDGLSDLGLLNGPHKRKRIPSQQSLVCAILHSHWDRDLHRAQGCRNCAK